MWWPVLCPLGYLITWVQFKSLRLGWKLRSSWRQWDGQLDPETLVASLCPSVAALCSCPLALETDAVAYEEQAATVYCPRVHV